MLVAAAGLAVLAVARAERRRRAAGALRHRGLRPDPDARLSRPRLRRPQPSRLRGHLHEPERRHASPRACSSTTATAPCCARGRSRARTSAADHGVQVATSDARGRLVLLDKAPAAGAAAQPAQRQAAHLRDLPAEALPNYAAWGRRGELYVTDYIHAMIWRVPPGGGEATVVARATRASTGSSSGPRASCSRPTAATCSSPSRARPGGGDGNPATGKIYEIEIGADGKPGRDPHGLGERAAGRAGRLRHRHRGAHLHHPAGRQPDRRDRSRRNRARALPDQLRRRRERLHGPVRQPVERDVPRPPADRRQPEPSLAATPPTRRSSTSGSASAGRRS